MVAYQCFELETDQDGDVVRIPQVHQQWREGLARLKEMGYKLLACKTETNGIPHSILIGFDLERFHELGNVKVVFYELAESLKLPFMSGEFYDDSAFDGRT